MQFDIRKLATTASTNDDAKTAAESGAPQGTVFWALEQKSGRGRQGRAWHSPVGNLYCSTILRPSVPLQDYGRYSFIAALAIHDAVKSFLPNADVQLKWPNDVLVNGKKISGILLESGEGWLVVGVGINVLHKPENPLYPVTSLSQEGGQGVELDILLDKYLTSLASWCHKADSQSFTPIREAWLSYARKGSMRVRLPKGEEIHGEFLDLDAQGNLHLQLPDGTRYSVNAGDVFF